MVSSVPAVGNDIDELVNSVSPDTGKAGKKVLLNEDSGVFTSSSISGSISAASSSHASDKLVSRISRFFGAVSTSSAKSSPPDSPAAPRSKWWKLFSKKAATPQATPAKAVVVAASPEKVFQEDIYIPDLASTAHEALAVVPSLEVIAEEIEDCSKSSTPASGPSTPKTSTSRVSTPKRWLNMFTIVQLQKTKESLRERLSDDSLSNVLKSVDIANDPQDRPAPLILKPGPLPEEVRSTMMMTRNDYYDDAEEKAARLRVIMAIMNDEVVLPKEFTDKYKLLELLGDGAFGSVFAVKILTGPMAGKEAAVKFILACKVAPEGWVLDQDLNIYVPFEAHFLKQVSHPNIIQLYDLFTDKKYIYMITELHGCEWRLDNPIFNPVRNYGMKPPPFDDLSMPLVPRIPFIGKVTFETILQRKRAASDLFECIDAHIAIPEAVGMRIFVDIVKAIAYLHSIGFVHRDIKDENICIDENYNVKIIDFGSASRIPEEGDEEHYFDKFNGTIHFASPEILRGAHYRGPEAEVWALGVLLFTIMYGQNPFHEPKDTLCEYVDYANRDDLPYVDLIKLMFNHDPKERITLEGIKAHPWLAGKF